LIELARIRKYWPNQKQLILARTKSGQFRPNYSGQTEYFGQQEFTFLTNTLDFIIFLARINVDFGQYKKIWPIFWPE
jgi:hypothetical protein